MTTRSDTDPQPADRSVRVLGAALAVAALAHVPPTGHHLAEMPYVGIGFVVFTLACLGLLLGLSARPAPALLAGTGLLCGGAVAAYAASRLVALPGLTHDVGAWLDPYGLAAVAAETVAAAAAVRLLLRREPRPAGMVGVPALPSRV